MPIQISIAKGTSNPTSSTGLTLGEPAFNYSNNTLWLGKGSGVSPVWVGAGVCGASGGIAAGTTTQIPTLGAVLDYFSAVSSSFLGTTAAYVSSFNGRTGAVQGVSAAVAGTGISVSGATGAVTITNIGVQSFNGLTGAVTGVTVGGANTFTALNTFNAGISSAGGTFSSLTRFTAGLSAAGITTSFLRVTGTSTFDGDISASTIRQNGASSLYIQNFVDTIYIGDGLGEGNGSYFVISDQSIAAELVTNTFDITSYTTCTSPDLTATPALTVKTDSSTVGAGNCFQVTNTFNSSIPVQVNAAGAMTLTGRLTASGGISASAGVTFSGTVASTSGYQITSGAINTQTGTTYTFLSGDNGKILTFNNGSAVTVTIPTNLPVGFNCTAIQLGAGQVGFTAASGVTMNAYASGFKISGQHGAASIISYATNIFNVSGTLSV